MNLAVGIAATLVLGHPQAGEGTEPRRTTLVVGHADGVTTVADQVDTAATGVPTDSRTLETTASISNTVRSRHSTEARETKVP